MSVSAPTDLSPETTSTNRRTENNVSEKAGDRGLNFIATLNRSLAFTVSVSGGGFLFLFSFRDSQSFSVSVFLCLCVVPIGTN